MDDSDNELIGGTLFARPGGKSMLRKTIIDNYFPKNYEELKYIEPFIGGGSIFFYKQPSIKEVINDLDKEVIEIYRGFKKYDGPTISKDINGIYNKNDFEIIKNSKPKNKYQKFIKELLLYKLSFFGYKKTFGAKNNKIKDRLKNTIILNKDYKDVINKYDSNNTFFYLDPPYEQTNEKFYENILSNIKGLFVLSTNDSKNLRELFKNFNIYDIKTKYSNPIQGGLIKRNELIITNFNNIDGKGKREAVGIGKPRHAPTNIKLYNQIKEQVYKEQPKHSLYRSARIQKEYKDAGGEYEDNNNNNNKMDINKWFGQKWLSVNDWLRGEEIQCGNSDTMKKYNEYAYCKPKAILEKLSNNQIKKLINEKNKLKSKPLITKKVLRTEKFNIKNTLTGAGNNKFYKQLEDLDIDKKLYFKMAKKSAKDAGYNPNLLKFSSNPKKKLNYDGIDFGALNYNDFIIYQLTQPEIANEKRTNYRKRAKKVMEKTNNKLSPASLSFYILW